MWNRIKALVWKEFLQLRRDRLTLAFTLGMPLMQLVIFGLAINYDVKHMPAVVLDESQSQESRSFVDGLVATQYFDVKVEVSLGSRPAQGHRPRQGPGRRLVSAGLRPPHPLRPDR